MFDEAEDAGVAAPMGFKPVVKRDRAAVVNMVQKAFKGYNDEQLQEPVAARAIRRTFVKAGQDPYAADTAAFTKYLNELEDHPVYGRAPDRVRETLAVSLLQNQMAALQLE